MSIPVLVQVYDEVRRLAIAGSSVAGGDFRLKKLVPPLEQSGQKAPVFAKVAQAVNQVIDSNEKSSATALLELSTLVNAILYTQGETGLTGELKPIPTINLGQQQTRTSARVLKPLLDALSETGSGRLETIRDASEKGTFRDLRLVGPALSGLDDPYPEIADFIAEQVLPLYGAAILSELRDRFDLKGRGGHVRRLRLMHQLDPQGTRETIKQALDEGSKEVKVVAIECLGDSPDDLSYLLDQTKAKAKDVRLAALKALSKSDASEAVKVLCEVLKDGDNESAIEPVRNSRNPQVVAFLLDRARQQFNAVLTDKSKDKAETAKLVSRVLTLLECLRGRDDAGTEQLLIEMFSQRGQLAKVKGKPSGQDIEQRLVAIMATGSRKAQRTLIDAHASLPADQLTVAFFAARQSCPPKEVFDLFSGYLATSANEKKRDPAALKREAIIEVLARNWDWPPHSGMSLAQRDPNTKVDPRWLDLAVELQRPELVLPLARPGHTKANQLMSQWFTEKLRKTMDPVAMGGLLRTMIQVQHPGATDAMLEAVATHSKSTNPYGLFWLAQAIPELPSAAVPRLEALLPSLPEKIVDQLVGFVTELKNRP